MNYSPVTAAPYTNAAQPVGRLSRGVATVTLGAVTSRAIVNTLSSYIVAKYDMSVLGGAFTLKPYQTWPGAVNCIPAISYVSGNVTVRWLLSEQHQGRVSFDLYTGQTIRDTLPTLELWSIGVASTFSFAEVEIPVGILLNTSTTALNYAITPCIVSSTGGDFSGYMTSCNFN